MSRFLDTVALAMVCSVPVTVMSLAVLLIRIQVDGWGVFLACAVFVSIIYVRVIEREMMRIRDDQSN